MEVSIKELRVQPSHYIALAEAGAEIIITSHGAKKARIIPISAPKNGANSAISEPVDSEPGFLFGIWSDRDDMEDVSAYVSALREGRVF